MTFVEMILSQMSSVAKTQFKFLCAMFAAFFAFRGKANMTNLHRYGAPHPRTQARWHEMEFDWVDFNLKLIDSTDISDHRLAAAIDCSFIPKSGTDTFGLGRFYNGCLGRAQRGLELSLLALVDLDENRAWAIDACQTEPKQPKGKTRIDFYLDQLRREACFFPPQVCHLLADSFYAKAKFVNGVCDEVGWDIVSKLRSDANLKYLYTGPSERRRGRPRKYDGKVFYDDLSRWTRLEGDETGLEYFEVVAWSVSFKRRIKVVCVRRRKGNKVARVLLFSTDTELEGMELVRMYRSRFQIEFIFRDAKGHTGLCDGQMRNRRGLHHHFNLSLAALNVLRLNERAEGRQVISLASIKRRKYNELLINHIFEQLGLDPTDQKIAPHLDGLRDFGVMAA